MKSLKPDDLRVEWQGCGVLTCSLTDGKILRDVRCTMLFPLSHPQEYISLHVEKDGATWELGIVVDMKSWPADQRRIVRQAVQESYFIPEITDILAVVKRYGLQEWRVVCDRGEREFCVVHAKDNIQTTGRGIILITDIEKCRYKILDSAKLPARAQQELDRAMP